MESGGDLLLSLRRWWRLLRRCAGAAGVVLRGLARAAIRAATDAYNRLALLTAHALFRLCRRCLYPVDLSAFHADAVSARGESSSSTTVLPVLRNTY